MYKFDIIHITYGTERTMNKQKNANLPINSISSFYALAHMLCEGYLYPVNTPIFVTSGNKKYSFSVAFDKKTEQIWLATYNTPANIIENTAEFLNNIITNTLEDLKLQINIINIADIDKQKLSNLNKKMAKHNTKVMYFADVNQAYKHLLKINQPHNFADNETVEACWNYLETLIEHINQTI